MVATLLNSLFAINVDLEKSKLLNYGCYREVDAFSDCDRVTASGDISQTFVDNRLRKNCCGRRTVTGDIVRF